MKKWIEFDLDGILCVEEEFTTSEEYIYREPLKTGLLILSDLYEKGYMIRIRTARHEEDRDVTLSWLQNHGVCYHEIEFDKKPYEMIIDDKAYNPVTIIPDFVAELFRAEGVNED